jgi:Universal stress protein UspA and related nucleotide-binding proteins
MTTASKGIYFKKILVGVDDSEYSAVAFDYAVHYAKEQHLGLTIVSVWDEDAMNVYQDLDDDYVQVQHKDLEIRMEEYRHEAAERGVKNVETIIVDGKPGAAIVREVIPKVKPDLLIIGAKSKNEAGVTHMGSEAAYMVKHSPVSVLVIR